MGWIRALIRIYSYLFHGLLALGLLAISGLALADGRHNLNLKMLPWEGKQLTFWLFFSGLAGIISLALAVRGTLRFLFLFYTLAVWVMLMRGFFFSSYVFANPGQFRDAVYLSTAALMAVVGGWLKFRHTAARKKRS